MARVSPLRNLHDAAEAETIPYAAPGAGPVEIVGTFGQLELEYAAIRRGSALFDLPNRATLAVTGEEAMDFLGRMLTQRLDDLAPWRARRSFWLSRQGRIDADLRIVRLPDRVLLDVDVHSAAHAKETLDAYIITEDVTIADETASRHRFALHGPRAAGLLAACAAEGAGDIEALEDGQVARCVIGGAEVIVDRQDALAVPGFELHMATDDAERIWTRLCEVGMAPEGKTSPHRLRPAGWHAFNTARVEAGWPVFRIDFGPDSLPHETGVVHDRISFKKGCFLGQEVVARMEARGAGKQILVAIKLEKPPHETSSGRPVQPITGEAVLDASDPTGAPIGVVTSSVLSPMLGDAPICFAQVSRKKSEAGAMVLVEAQGARMPGEIQPSLTFLKPVGSAG
jgi:folate-binding protein YgfZ